MYDVIFIVHTLWNVDQFAGTKILFFNGKRFSNRDIIKLYLGAILGARISECNIRKFTHQMVVSTQEFSRLGGLTSPRLRATPQG